ncbi:MAG: hypothetical protein J6X84_03075 [Treponema sp.]|nr:hypothetical protein [Treponema sp.]
MQSRENPLFGRKVFFIGPSYIIEKYLIERLRQNEYEVYILKDIKKAKSVLAKFPDSMCFINIDSEFSYSEWFNYMKSFQYEESTSGIYLGVLTDSASWEDKDKFLMNIKLPGGFNRFEKTDKFVNTLMAILDLNGAKGRRKYLRLDTRGMNDVSGYMTSEEKLYTVSIRDLSSAGFAVTYRQELMALFQKNTLIRNLSLTVGRKTMICSCIVFNTQANPDGTAMSVLMLTNENPEETKVYIRNFIFEKFSLQMEGILETVEKDTASYSQSDEYSKLIAVQDRNYDELIPVTELDEPEEISEEAPAVKEINSKYTGNLDDDLL